MTAEKPGRVNRSPDPSPHFQAATMDTQNDDKIYTNFKVKNFTSSAWAAEETNKNIEYGKYEPFNVLSEYGDSIYTSISSSSEAAEQKGQFYVSIDILDEIVDQIRLLQKAMALLRKDLIKAGVLKAA